MCGAPVFKDLVDKQLEAILFLLVRSGLRPILALTLLCQTQADWSKSLKSDLVTTAVDPLSLPFGANGWSLKLQFWWATEGFPSHFLHGSLSVHMWRTLWLKCWAVEFTSKKHLICMAFEGQHTLNTIIKNATGANCTKQKKMRAQTGKMHPPLPDKKSLCHHSCNIDALSLPSFSLNLPARPGALFTKPSNKPCPRWRWAPTLQGGGYLLIFVSMWGVVY